MLSRKKTADALINLIGIIERQLNLTDEEQIKLVNEIHKLYLKIMKDLYPNI